MDESCFTNVFNEFVKPSVGRWTSNVFDEFVKPSYGRWTSNVFDEFVKPNYRRWTSNVFEEFVKPCYWAMDNLNCLEMFEANVWLRYVM